MFTREKMLFSKAVVAASFLIVAFNAISAIPRPGVVRERHIIHAPIKYKLIHHYSIKKVPILIKKHVHYYKPQEEIQHHSKPSTDDNHVNQIYEEDSAEGHRSQFERPLHAQEEDYEEAEQSQEENEEYEDYEYE